MKTFKSVSFILACTLFTLPALAWQDLKMPAIKSPDKKITLEFIIDKGKAFYSVKQAGKDLILNSALGLVCGDEDFSQNLSISSISKLTKIKDNYTMLYGKQQHFNYLANQSIVELNNQSGKRMDITFQISDQGVAFRYTFPDATGKRKITSELSSYNFTSGTKAWIQHMPEAKTGWASTQPSYEENYVQNTDLDKLPESKFGWIYPALFKSGNSWLLISETAPYREYCGTRLMHQDGSNSLTVGLADKREVFPGGGALPESSLPWNTPWRFIAISNTLSGIVGSTLGTDLAKPAVKGDFSYVKPGLSSWSWVLLKDDQTIFKVQKEFVDYAAEMGWKYCLVDALWDTQIGNDKMAELCAYAKTKNVGILVWYNSAGDWNTTYQGPKNRMLTPESRRQEFEWMNKVGIKGIKVDFFGGDGQSMMAYYIDILEDAAKYNIMVNFHGCTLPRGLQRTYPNLVSMEAVRGFENVTFEQSNADMQPTQCCMLPFTRNVFDPMDYTPTCFSEVPRITRRTSNAFELALPFIFRSGITHIAEIPKGMENAPKYVQDLLKNVPSLWDQSQLVDGFPGEYVIMAGEKNGTWYVSGINGTDKDKTVTFILPYVKAKTGRLIIDGDTNRSFEQQLIVLPKSKLVHLTLKAFGGFVMKF